MVIRDRGNFRRGIRRRRWSIRDDAIVQRLPPENLEVEAGVLGFPESANDFVTVPWRLFQEGGEQFVPRSSGKKRLDHRLHDRDGAVARASVAPAFERVCFRRMPATKLRRLVAIQTEMDSPRNFRQ